ncbi:MAG: hypothetical protein OEM43_05750 [Gammaproteobacteria bacterium]|nr:hypothetical protein [Gammaproteobacteria bacterium]
MTIKTLAAAMTNWQRIITLLALLLLLLANPLQAAPGGGKGGGKDGGGIGGSGVQPELHLKWRVELNGQYSLVRPVIGADGTVYAVDVADYLYAVAPDGTVLWEAAGAGSKGVDVGPDGTIYTGNEDWIKAYNPDGSLKWTFVQDPRAFVFQDVAVGPDGNIYGIGTSGMGVFSLADTPAGPELRWSTSEIYGRPFTSYTEIEFGPTADGQDEQLYFHANGFTRAVRLSDGAEIFRGGVGNTNPRVSAFDGTVHSSNSAFTPNAELVWAFEFPLASGTGAPALGPSGTHYAVNSNNVLYAIDPFGVEERRFALDETVGMGDVDPTESFLLLETSSTQTYQPGFKAVATNGNPLWRMEFPDNGSGLNQFIGSRPAFTSNGETAYVTTAFAGTGARSYLNAIDTDPNAPSASTILRSVNFDMSSRSRRGTVNVKGIATVTDQNRAVISGAVVDAVWTLPDGSTIAQTATTGGSGSAKFTVSDGEGLYRLTVTDITLTGYTFDPVHSILEGSWYGF